MRRFPFLTGLIIITVWIAVEITMFNLVAGWTGGLVAFLLFVLKSVAGFFFVGQLLRRKLMNLSGFRIVSLDGAAATTTSLKIIGSLLLVIPGFLAGVVGLALLTPSIRALIVGRMARKVENPRDFDLKADDWREISEPPPKRIRRARKKDDGSQ
jgi:UPF0716 family protein affecting phage T7 exclusion